MDLLPGAKERLREFLLSHDFYVALYETATNRSEYSPFGEVKASGYTAGGAKLKVEKDLFCEKACWPNSSIKARSALLYDKNTGVGFGFEVFPEVVTSTRDDFDVHFNGKLFLKD